VKTNSLLSKVRRLNKDAKPPVQEVDIVAILIQGREDSRNGIVRTPKPLTPEEVAEMERTLVGRTLLAARRRVGWH
jgi:hypothetical protein